jgi:hypothetical protein
MCFRVGRSAFLAVLAIAGASAAASARASECVNLPTSTLHIYGIRISMPEVQSVPAAHVAAVEEHPRHAMWLGLNGDHRHGGLNGSK